MDDLGFVKYCASSLSDIHIFHKPGPGNEFEFEPVCSNQMCSSEWNLTVQVYQGVDAKRFYLLLYPITFHCYLSIYCVFSSEVAYDE